MSKKFVLIPLQTFNELCSQTRKSGDNITGVLKSFTENGSKKRQKSIPKKR